MRLTRPANPVLGEEFRDFLEVFLEFENVQSSSFMTGSSADESQIFEADEELSSWSFVDRSQRYGVPPTDFYYLAKACADVARIAKVEPTEIFRLVGRSGVSVTLYGKLNIFTLQFEAALNRILLFAQAMNDLPDDEPKFFSRDRVKPSCGTTWSSRSSPARIAWRNICMICALILSSRPLAAWLSRSSAPCYWFLRFCRLNQKREPLPVAEMR